MLDYRPCGIPAVFLKQAAYLLQRNSLISVFSSTGSRTVNIFVNIICSGGHDEADAVSAEISYGYAKIYRYIHPNRRAYGHFSEMVYIVRLIG